VPYTSTKPDPSHPVVRRARPAGKPRLAVSSWQRGAFVRCAGGVRRSTPQSGGGWGQTACRHGRAMVRGDGLRGKEPPHGW
jgi:hypothetical protein